MYNIDPNLHATNAFCRDLADETRAIEEELRQLQTEREAYYRQQMIGYVNRIPYSCMTPVSPYQWRAPYATMQDNFVSYWEQVDRAREQERIAQEQRTAQQEKLRRAFRTAADVSALACKQSTPVTSIVFDGVGILTAGDLLEAAKPVMSIIDTATDLTEKMIQCLLQKVIWQPKGPVMNASCL